MHVDNKYTEKLLTSTSEEDKEKDITNTVEYDNAYDGDEDDTDIIEYQSNEKYILVMNNIPITSLIRPDMSNQLII